MASQPAVRFGPATLQDGVRRLHAWGLLNGAVALLAWREQRRENLES